MAKVVFAAGGTGGHIFPALAIAEAMRAEEPMLEPLFVGTGKPIEEKLVGAAGYRLEMIPFVPLSGKGLRGALRLAARVPVALAEAVRLLRRERPSLVIGFGGYPCFMPMLAAALLRIPTALHEQNVRAGLANKALSLIADTLFAVEGSEGFWSKKPVLRLANPTRAVFQTLPPWKAPQAGEPWQLLIMGGSQGAVSLNDAILELIPDFRRLNVHVRHQAGARDAERVRERYEREQFDRVEVSEFIDDIASAYAAAHLVICRAGAMTVAEVSAAGRPAVYVPLRIAGGHQADNVAHLVSRGAARAFPQTPELVPALRAELERLFADPAQLEEMGRRARESSRQGELSAAAAIARAALKGTR